MPTRHQQPLMASQNMHRCITCLRLRPAVEIRALFEFLRASSSIGLYTGGARDACSACEQHLLPQTPGPHMQVGQALAASIIRAGRSRLPNRTPQPNRTFSVLHTSVFYTM